MPTAISLGTDAPAVNMEVGSLLSVVIYVEIFYIFHSDTYIKSKLYTLYDFHPISLCTSPSVKKQTYWYTFHL
jgi:intracellular septation protein A